jgi:mannose-1-phosphate guanylyltransferase/mannose-1-phosphate guanylyltransferase/phosphomannomutase
VYGRPLRGYLLDIGTPAAYAQAQQEWSRRQSRVENVL